jgi:hypothetical protein
MRSFLRFVGRRIFLGQARKLRWFSRIFTVVGVTRFISRTIRPTHRVVLARDEQMEVRISKRDRHTI